MIYFDNNATTIMPVDVKKALIEWCNQGNPSSGYASAVEARKMMSNFRTYIGKLCGVDPCCPEDRDSNPTVNAVNRADPNKYKVIFTSGASESNCMALQSVVDSYSEITGKTPHVVMSAVEHKSLYEMALSYEKRGKITLTLVMPTPSGHIMPKDIEDAITDNTCIVCVMHANNETGAINDIKKIGAVAHKHNVVFHCDTVQTFGKFPINPLKENVDSMSVSFHKFHGPPGIGVLMIKQQLLLGYKISPMIFGTQNEGLRGGTENLPGIGAAFAATKYSMQNRAGKNKSILEIKKYIMSEISKRMPARSYLDYLNDTKMQNQKSGTRPVPNKTQKSQPEIEIIFLSGDEGYLPNTILLSVVKRTSPQICNGQLKKDLENVGIVVSVGSACNTASSKASHVITNMGVDEHVRRGALRISLGDDNTLAEGKKFVQEFLRVIKAQIESK